MKILTGIASSPGTAIGPVYQFVHEDLRFDRRVAVELDEEWTRLETALTSAEEELGGIGSRAAREVGEQEAAIFTAQAAMLRDPELLRMVRAQLEKSRVNVEASWCDTVELYVARLEQLQNEYIRARVADLRDASRRVLRLLLGRAEAERGNPGEPSIICADDLSPSDAVELDKKTVLGFCMAHGGATSHTAILARSLGLPAVVGLGESLAAVAPGTRAILSGSEGTLVLDPSSEAIQSYSRAIQEEREARSSALDVSHRPAVTLDGRKVHVSANVNDIESVNRSLEMGADGVGLLRTEFLYMHRRQMPTEEEQYQSYLSIFRAVGERPVTMRTLDIGGDKELRYLKQTHEMNPSLGVRGIRLSLRDEALFRPQLRAALRAGAGRDLRIMFPMVAVVEEVRAARRIVEDCRAELEREKQRVSERLQLGIMIEVPSAALLADHLADEVDFFSIGTNDLTQYALAADRTNTAVSHLTSPLSPAILGLVRRVVEAGHRKHKWVAMCGELAADVRALPVLLGLEIDELSMSPAAIPLVKQAIRSMSVAECRDVAMAALSMASAQEVKDYLDSLYTQ
jgi:phosphotransferase system enzyme I (PtsI)